MEVYTMSRKNRSPEEQARRAKIRELLQESNISSMEDIQSLFKETIAEFRPDTQGQVPENGNKKKKSKMNIEFRDTKISMIFRNFL